MNQSRGRHTDACTAIAGAVALLAMHMAAAQEGNNVASAAASAAGGQRERPGKARTAIVTGLRGKL